MKQQCRVCSEACIGLTCVDPKCMKAFQAEIRAVFGSVHHT